MTKDIKNATVGELIVELCKLTIKSTKETNSPRGLTKKTADREDSILNELYNRGILNSEQLAELNK